LAIDKKEDFSEKSNHITDAQSSSSGEDEIKLVELILIVWWGKWWILLFGFLGTLVGVTYALLQPNIYESKVMYVIQDGQPELGLSGAAALLGGFGGAGSGLSGKYEVILQSTDLYLEIIRKNDLLKEVLATKVDPSTGNWRKDLEKEPSLMEGVEVFQEMLFFSIGSKDAKTLTMKVQHQDSLKTFEWLGYYTTAFLEKIEEIEKQASRETLDFYEKKMQSTESLDVRSALAKLIVDETKNAVMIGKARFQVVDKPRVPEKRVKPRRSLIVVVSMVIGALLGVFWVFSLGFLKELWGEIKMQRRQSN